MRSIDVSTDVFAGIWARRVEGEETENAILSRILMEHHSISPLYSSIEPVQPANDGSEVSFATWRDDVSAALSHLGGRARLGKIYAKVEEIRRNAGRSVPPSLEATIRRTLEDHSSDSSNYRGGLDMFRMPEGKGAGVWSLK